MKDVCEYMRKTPAIKWQLHLTSLLIRIKKRTIVTEIINSYLVIKQME